MVPSHLNALKTRHADLDAKIAHEERRPAPDATRLAEWKKRKLKVKEAMVQRI